MHIYITGGTGYIGTALQKRLHDHGYQVTTQSRNPRGPHQVGNAMEVKTNIDAVINLAGAGIADKRWTTHRKQVLQDSRIELSKQLLSGLTTHQPKVFISASAIGYYGLHGDELVDEDTPAGRDFAAQLCQQWEDAVAPIASEQTRLVTLRFGVVIGPNGGFIGKLLPAYKIGLGGRLGDGQQWLSWVALDDLLDIIIQALHNEWRGVFNATSPNPVRQAEFNQAMGKLLHKPTLGNLPKPLLKMMFGEMSMLLWGGQRVAPKKLLTKEFEFRYPKLENALKLSIDTPKA
jgi:uncharacterized protein (TIGR01777 family)